MAAMTERPILFSGEMVKAILCGTKHCTRRIIKAPKWSTPDKAGVDFPCRYGCEGDRLWCKETFSMSGNGLFYRATDAAGTIKISWTSPLFMRREYSRITLELVSVRVERLHDISREDVLAEG